PGRLFQNRSRPVHGKRHGTLPRPAAGRAQTGRRPTSRLRSSPATPLCRPQSRSSGPAVDPHVLSSSSRRTSPRGSQPPTHLERLRVDEPKRASWTSVREQRPKKQASEQAFQDRAQARDGKRNGTRPPPPGALPGRPFQIRSRPVHGKRHGTLPRPAAGRAQAGRRPPSRLRSSPPTLGEAPELAQPRRPAPLTPCPAPPFAPAPEALPAAAAAVPRRRSRSARRSGSPAGHRASTAGPPSVRGSRAGSGSPFRTPSSASAASTPGGGGPAPAGSPVPPPPPSPSRRRTPPRSTW